MRDYGELLLAATAAAVKVYKNNEKLANATGNLVERQWTACECVCTVFANNCHCSNAPLLMTDGSGD